MTNPAANVALGVSTPPHSQLHLGRAADGVVYVSTAGSDTESGNTWGTAKATIAAAIAVLPAGGGIIEVGAGTWTTTAETSITKQVKIRGRGVGVTVLSGGISGGFVFKRFGTGSTIDGIEISDLTIDLNGVATASGVGVEYVTNFSLRRVKFANGGSGWGAFIGVLDGTDNVARNNGVLLEDCQFDGHNSTTEQLLLFNSARVTLRRVYFSSIGASAWAIGLYQNLDRVLIDDCEIASVVGNGVYYSVSCNNITFRSCRFPLGAVPISGARQSDNGAFSALRVSGLRLIDCRFFSNSAGTAVELGAVRDAKVIGCDFTQCKEIAVGIFNGDTPVNSAPDHIQIIGCTFRNNNQAGTLHILHPAVYVASTGNLDLSFVGCDFVDDQGTKTQRYPVTFEGAITPARIEFVDCQLLADTANGGTSLAVNDGATVGSTVRLLNCRDVSATLPSGVQSFNSAGRDPLGPTTPSVGASPWTYTAGNQPEVLHLRGGTVSNIAKGGTTLQAATPASIFLQPGEAVVVTYTAAPTAVADRK